MEKETQWESNLYSRYDELKILWWYRKMLNIFIRALWWKFESELWFDTNDKIVGVQRWLTDWSNFYFRDYLDATHGKIKDKVYEDDQGRDSWVHCVFKILFDSGNSIVFSRDGYKGNWVFSLDSYLKRLDEKSKKNFFDINKKLYEIEHAHFTSREYVEWFEHSEKVNNLIEDLRKKLASNLNSKPQNW